ncbi:MAG: aspartate--tRNA ligase [Clostridiaceae bacterium]|nr:aspartate--tRNA ligase [Clostridiaceae bacterium]
MSDTMKGLKRTIMNGYISEKNIGETVVLTGWVAKARNLGSLIFVDLRDRTGIVQLVFDSTVDEEIFKKAEKIRNEYVLCVKGVVRPRGKEAINPKMATGMIEVCVDDLRILSEAETSPIHVDDKAVTGEVNRLKYRYLDLRKPSIQKNLILRHEVARYARNFFADNGFLEIETPMLSKSTPEGARDYLVPSRIHHGKFYALPQSPQLYKQLLMVAGFDRYIQIVKCFRDEDLRADRQPEFTQIDLEMSFVDMDDVMSINEEFLKGLFKKVMGVDVETPFRRMSYKEAMDKYGTDKPDTRFGMELKDISSFAENCSFGVFKDTVKNGGCVKLISASGAGSFSRKEIDKLVEFVKFHGGKGMAWIINGENETRSSLGKVLTEEEIKEIINLAESNVGDLVCIVSDKCDVVNTALGALRCHIAEKLGIIPDKYEFLWVTDFPLFEYSEEEDRYVAKHHPFTMPVDEDIDMIETNPEKVRAKAYDIVLNGYEIGGGSIRIYDNALQKRMFKALGFSEEDAYERFGFLLDAFRYGTPPHGGMAYGLDRLVMIMANCDNIRDVIAFPKVQNASCLMTGAPGTVEEKQLKELNIKIVEE